MSAIGEILAELKKVILLQEDVAPLQRNVEGVAADLRRTRDYADMIDRRLIRVETLIEAAMGASQPPQPRLPQG